MRRLVALDMPASPAFLDELRRCFDAGDAVLPLDNRLAPPAKERLVAALRPAEIVSSEGSTRLAGAQPVEDGDAFVLATSGTTGEAKGVVLTHDAVAASAGASSARLGIDASRDRWLCCLPVAHVGGLSVITRALATGTPLEVMARFDAKEVMRLCRARDVTRISLVATALLRLAPEDAASFTTILLGGAAPPDELGANVVSTYGLTESGSGVVYDGAPLDGVEVRIGEDEEIFLRAPMLFRAYRDGTDPKDEAGFFPTNDAGAIDENGHLVVFGRRGELIISGGENIWPAAVEGILARHEAVGEVAVAGVMDATWGQRVVAFVVAKDEARPPLLEELRALVGEQLGSFASPRELVLVSSLPRTSIGKVKRDALSSVVRLSDSKAKPVASQA